MNHARATSLAFAAVLAVAMPAAARDAAQVPYVPTPPAVVDAMLDLAGLETDERLVDLGSGDGRIVIAAAKRGAIALGVELGSDLVRRARENARLEGVEARASFRRADLFSTTLREADVATLYLLPEVNLRLRPKLLAELRPGARVVSHAFDMGDWSPDERRIVGGSRLYLWVVPAAVGGRWNLDLVDGRSAVLELDQRFQTVSGTFGGTPIRDATLSGDKLRFTIDGRAFHALVSDRTLSPDPAAPADAVGGWRAERSD